MFTQTDEEDLFPTNTNSNLTNLFGGGSITNPQKDLKYTAPRQPRPTDLIPKELSDTISIKMDTEKVSVICAKVVTANKLINNEILKVGKLGFAILGTKKTIKEFLLYRDRQNVLAKATNNDQFSFLEEEKDVLKFSDDSETIWLVQFINNNEYDEFIKEVQIRNIKILKPEMKLKQIYPKKVENIPEDSQIRADILTRMAKMGQSVLPGTKLDNISVNETKINDNQSQISDEVSDKQSENENIEKDTSIMYQNQYLNPQILNPAQIQPYIPLQTYQQYHQVPTNQEFNLFMSENRTQNSEMRINLSSISTKLDMVLHEMSKLKISPNTDRLENEFLKSKLYDLEGKLTKLNDFEVKTKELEENNRVLEENLKRLRSKSDHVDDLEMKESMLLKEINELRVKLREKDEKFIEIEKKNIENESFYKKILEENDEFKKSKERLESGNVIKIIMNEMFQNVLGEFKEDELISFKQVKSSISNHMKQTTFKIIDSINN